MGLDKNWNKNAFSIYNVEEQTVLKILEKMFSSNKEIINEIEGKTDLNGDHKGSWQGLTKPTLSEEGMRSVVEEHISDINNLKNNFKTSYVVDSLSELKTLAQKENNIIISSNKEIEVDSPIEITKSIYLKDLKIKVKDNTVVRPIIIRTSDVILENITIDGNRASQGGQTHFLNDLITIENTSNVSILKCKIKNSWGGGISVYKSNNCKILFNDIQNIYDNGILIAELGADDNLIMGNNINGTTVQNGIFLTAKADSTITNDYIYNNKIIANTCKNIGDTCIESGINTNNSIITNNKVYSSNHPSILLRDSINFLVTNNNVEILNTSSDDGISVVPHYKGSTLIVNGIINNNIIRGDVNRSAIGIFQDGVTVKDNDIRYTSSIISSDGSNLKGNGILTDGRNELIIEGNQIQNYSNGIYVNYGDTTRTLQGLVIKDNTINYTKNSINLWNTSLYASVINDNIIKNSFSSIIKDGDGNMEVTQRNNLYFKTTPSAINYDTLPNQSFISNIVTKAQLPNTLYSVSTLLKMNRSTTISVKINGSAEVNNPSCMFDIIDGNEIINFRGHRIGTNDSSQWKIIIVEGVLQIQNRIETSENLYISTQIF